MKKCFLKWFKDSQKLIENYKLLILAKQQFKGFYIKKDFHDKIKSPE